jgi:hypothetical protein
MLEHDPGLPASPPVRYILKVPRSGYFPLLNPFIVRCWKDKSFAKRQPLSARPAGTSDVRLEPRASGGTAISWQAHFEVECVGSRWFWKLVMQQVLGSTARRLADAAAE